MIRIVKNEGQIKELAGKCKYLMAATLHVEGKNYTMYAKPSLKPIFGYGLAKIKFSKMLSKIKN